MRYSFPIITCTLAALVATPALPASFQGSFEFRWLSDPANNHRIMQLLSDVSFTDAKGKKWSVPKGTRIDGASIPQVLWTFSGSPFVGNYRRASVIHDHFCVIDTESTPDTHDMFREAAIADGVSVAYANTMRIVIGIGGTGCGYGQPFNRTFNILSSALKPGMADQFGSQLNRLDNAGSDLYSMSVGGRQNAVQDMFNVPTPRTLEATAQFKDNPTEENLQALQAAVEAENPEQEDIYLIESLILALSTEPPQPGLQIK